jgi:hypothetical protein
MSIYNTFAHYFQAKTGEIAIIFKKSHNENRYARIRYERN